MTSEPGPGDRRCAVLGSPIAHSLSPVLHRAAYAQLGLGWEYGAREVTEDACLLACEAVERAVGARGLLAPHPAERLLRDLRMYLRQPAPDAARLHLGRAVLDAPELADDAYSPWGDEGL